MSEQEYDKEQLRIMRNAFKAFDHDEKGYIDHADVVSILEILGQKLDDKATKALIKEVDKGNSGRLDFSQFCRLASRFVEVEEDVNALANELKEAFRVYDKEGKGYLTVQTLRDILRELDDKLSKDDLDNIIEEIDADGSGTVDFDEFMQVMTGKNYYDFIWQRRFAFEPCAASACQRQCRCCAPRMRLHRRIEWHFERFFQQMQMWQPFQAAKRARPPITACSSSTVSPCPFQMLRSKIPISKSTSTLATCRCRPVFRPRFPKWVPILTLYREIVQNSCRRRGHYLIERY